MYQLAGTPDQQYLQQHMMAQQGQPGMSRNASFNGMTQQQQQQQQQGSGHGWHPLPLHVPKRWSLELQRLGSFTSQLLPGAKSPTGQQGQQGPQQQQQHGRGHHSRNSSFGMGHLPEEAPLSDAALKVLESSLPSLLGRTHQTHMGLAVPLSSAGSSSAGAAASGAAAVAAAAAGGGDGTASFSAPGSFGAGSSFGAVGGPGSYLQRLEAGSISKSSSVHEQMLQLAASLAQQDGAAAGTSAAPSACGESTACTDWDGSACGEHQQQQKGCAAASWLPPGSSMDGLPPPGPHAYFGLQHKQQLLPHAQQRLSLDQRRAFSVHQQQQQQQAAVAAAGARMSLDSTAYPPAGLARIQQHLLPEEHSAGSSSGITPELSLKGMLSQSLQQQHGTPRGSTDNLLAAAGAGSVSRTHSSSKLSGIGGISKSHSSSKLSVQSPAVGPGAGSIVSLSPAATDCLIALGLINRLSGITDACRLAEQASAGSSSSSNGSSSFSSPLGPLLEGLVGAAWASEAAAVAKVAAAECIVPVVCRLVEGPDGMPRYKLDEDHIRRAQPSLVVVACEENSRDEPLVQHHQQLQDSTRRKSAAGGSDAADAAQGSGADAAANWAWPISPAGQVGSTTNGAVAVPGRVRLKVAVVQRVLQRAGVLWPEQRAVVLYQRCHSVSEVLEFILVLANAAGVPERGVQLVAGLRARLRAAACRVCRSMRSSRAATLAVSRRGSSSVEGAAAAAGGAASAGPPLVMVLDGVNPVRLAGFWLPEMLQLAGGKQASICPAAAEPPSNISWSQLRAAAPGMLILALQGLNAGQAALHMEQLAVQPGFWALPAVRSGAVYAVDHTLLCRPGPGLVLGVELLGHLVAPEQQPLPAGLPMGSVLKLSLHSGQRCRPRLLPNYMARYC
jgi:ABC-type hemin transport system substrate-binding protein